jgi:hypothetical protein
MPKTAENPTRAQQADQARHLVQSTVHDLATGTDKRFWFSGPPYGSCASDFGCFGLFGTTVIARARSLNTAPRTLRGSPRTRCAKFACPSSDVIAAYAL